MSLQSPERHQGSLKPPSNLLVGGLAVVAALSIAGNVWLGIQVRTLRNDPMRVTEMENAALVAEVRALMVLPDEQPTIATVTDLEKLKGQSFFDHAQVGFKVFVFTAAKKAVLYDPTAHKIVEVAPLTEAQPDPSVSPSTTDVDGTAAADEAETETAPSTTRQKK